jgi:Uncharacterized conserved protein
MDFIDSLRQFSTRVAKMHSSIQTEEATKTSLIMPFFQSILGFDVFNPYEFVPEFVADVGTKKGEKVDYAIFVDDAPAILIEAKWCGATLDKHDSQLFRYFGTTSAKFGILTNGIIYKFYTDLELQNRMDLKPFLVIDMLNIKDSAAAELKKFHKSTFNIDELATSASVLKYTNDIRALFAAQLREPSDEFIRFFLSQVYDGLKTQPIVDKFRPIIRDALNNYITELMNDKITSALKPDKVPDIVPESVPEPEPAEEASKIVTTPEELESFSLIKAILFGIVTPDRLSYRDTESYFSILLDNNIRKWICRLRLGGKKSFLIIPDAAKKEQRIEISSQNDVLLHKDEIIAVVMRYIEA